MDKTPIQEAIQLLEAFISNRPTPNDYEHGKEIGYQNAIDNLKALLPKEKEFVEHIWMQGVATGYQSGKHGFSNKPTLPEFLNQLYTEK